MDRSSGAFSSSGSARRGAHGQLGPAWRRPRVLAPSALLQVVVYVGGHLRVDMTDLAHDPHDVEVVARSAIETEVRRRLCCVVTGSGGRPCATSRSVASRAPC